jgi:hypothetical protein
MAISSLIDLASPQMFRFRSSLTVMYKCFPFFRTGLQRVFVTLIQRVPTVPTGISRSVIRTLRTLGLLGVRVVCGDLRATRGTVDAWHVILLSATVTFFFIRF